MAIHVPERAQILEAGINDLDTLPALVNASCECVVADMEAYRNSSGCIIFSILVMLVTHTPVFYPSEEDILNIRYLILDWMFKKSLPY
jgi:hypothetical protein